MESLSDDLKDFLKKAGWEEFPQNNSETEVGARNKEAEELLENISLTDDSRDEELTEMGSLTHETD